MSDLGGRRKVKKTTVEECWSLDACSLAKEGVFKPARRSAPRGVFRLDRIRLGESPEHRAGESSIGARS